MSSLSLIEILRSLIIPPFNLLLLFLLGSLIGVWKPRTGKILRNSAWIILLVISSTLGSSVLVWPLEQLEPVLSSSKNTGAQAIVVLSAGRMEHNPEYDNQSIPDYIALGRIRYAAKLYRDTGLPILVSGGLNDKATKTDTLAQEMARVLEYEFAIPVKWQEGSSSNTWENAQNSAIILKKAGIRHVLLVTDAMHMRRAKYAFEQAGIKVSAAPTLFFRRMALVCIVFYPLLKHSDALNMHAMNG